MDGIFLFTWKIFGIRGKNIFQKIYVAHKNSAHYSCSCTHTIVALKINYLIKPNYDYLGFRLNLY